MFKLSSEHCFYPFMLCLAFQILMSVHFKNVTFCLFFCFRQHKQRKTRQTDDEPSVRRIKKTDDTATTSHEDVGSEEKEDDKTNVASTNHREIIVKLPAEPQVLAKNYDLKRLSK